MDDAVCKGAWELGTACGRCTRCRDTCDVASLVIREMRAKIDALDVCPPSDIEGAACNLAWHFRQHDANVQAVGVGDNHLLLYLYMRSRTAYLTRWQGWPVRTAVVGKIAVASGGY